MPNGLLYHTRKREFKLQSRLIHSPI
jgi:hypothetical protein